MNIFKVHLNSRSSEVSWSIIGLPHPKPPHPHSAQRSQIPRLAPNGERKQGRAELRTWGQERGQSSADSTQPQTD